ncbi:MAG: condensation domain-containing protein [Pseudonocardiaceae bacterium]
MTHDEVAIIGAATLMPGADGLGGLHERLREGYQAIGQPSSCRIQHSGTCPQTPYLPMGYLARVDLFDHRYFGLSLREAELMDPHQRLALQLAHEAVENAGYAPRQLRGSRTAVVLSAADAGYQDLFAGSDPQQVLGSSSAAIAARVSYLFDFAGPALVVDTACSSSLSAVAQAVWMLRDGNADLALAGGVSVQPVLIPQRDHAPLTGVESPTGTCRPFDARADGTAGGEGGGIVVLKLLSTAIADHDHIIGVLKGIAVNHNGYRAASMSAPSQLGQAEVITQAWRDAGIDARSVGYVECHGSATPLGDVVEADALRRAFLEAGVDGAHCTIGSIKGNIGHLGNAAGMAGLFRALCTVRHGVRYPAVHFETPNPLIDFSGPIQLSRTGGDWPEAAGTPRRAGVSSFGLTGTNVHAVLERAPVPGSPPAADLASAAEPASGVELVTVSARSSAALARYCALLADFVSGTEHSLPAVARVLNQGRDDHEYRLACTVADKSELRDTLRSTAVPEREVVPDAPVVLLLSSDAQIDEPAWSRLCAELPELATAVEELAQPCLTPQGLLVGRQWALCRMLSSWGLADLGYVGNGTGNLVVRCLQDELSPAETVLAAAAAAPSAEIDETRLRSAAEGFRNRGAVLVEIGADGVLSRQLRRVAPELATVALLAGPGRRGLLEQLGQIYLRGATLDWERYYRGVGVARIEAPTYPFEPVRCWVTPVGSSGAGRGPAAGDTATGATSPRQRAAAPPGTGTERHIVAVWEDVLKATGLHSQSDYFALGGTSIAGISVLRRLEQDLGVALRFADLYAHRTVRSLAERVDELRGAGRDGDHRDGDHANLITPIRRGGRLPLSFGQEQLWYLDCLNPGSPLYNIPADLRLRGPLDVAAVRDALRDLTARHEILRTCIRSAEGEPFAQVLPARPELHLLDLRTLPPAQRELAARRRAEEEALLPFDLAEGPLLRSTLLKLDEDDHVLLHTYHHIIFDGWSPSVFFRDFFEFYRARREGRPAQLPELPIQYADFAAWQRSRLQGQRLQRGLDFWRDQLAGLRSGELPLDHPRPASQGFTGDLVMFTIDGPLAGRVRQFSQRHGVTTFVTMLAVVDALLHRWAHWEDVVVGVGTSGRMNPATHELIGYFNNLPPFRTRVSPDLAFTDLVRRCADTVAGVLDHEEMPLEKIVSAVCHRRDSARHPLFDVAYTYQNAPSPTVDPAELTIDRFLDHTVAGVPPGTAKFDLTFGILDDGDGEMSAYIEYAVALFDRETVRRIAGWLPAILDAAMTDPRQRIDQLPGPLVPSQVVRHERLPRTATGKLDRKDMTTMATPTTTGDQRAETALQTLTRVCAEILSVDRVDPDDNFFELGGDSVLGIRLAARTAKAGVFFTPQQLLQHQTMGALAAAAAGASPAPAPDTSPTRTVAQPRRPIQLTPIMHGFLERVPQGARGFVEMHPLETTTRVDGETMRAAVDHVLARHEPFRYRFRRNSLGWRIDCAEPGVTDIFDVQILPPLSEPEELAVVAADLEDLRSRIDLERGPALRVRYYDRGHNRNGWLVFVVHHFVLDNMATVVLIDDLDAALTGILAGRRLEPPPPSQTWSQWSQHLQDMAVSEELAGELTYWTGILRAGADTLARTDRPARGDAAPAISRTLDPDRVAKVLVEGGPRAQEAALCAFASALARWRGTPSAYLMTEGQATPNVYRPAGWPPAVGWFTSMHPLVLPVNPDISVLDCLPAVADRIRSVPNDGVGYGILRHVTPDSPRLAQLRALPEPDALVVHSSRAGSGSDAGSGADAGLRLLRNRFDLLADTPLRSIPSFPLELITTVDGGTLQLIVIHDGRYGENEQIDTLADEVVRAFAELAK